MEAAPSTDQHCRREGESTVAQAQVSHPDGSATSGSLVAGTALKEDWCSGIAGAEEECCSPTPGLPNVGGHSSEDDYEVEQEEEDGYEGVGPHADSDEFSELGDEPGDTEVVFVKEGVNVWPARNERIMGRLSLIKQHGVLFLAWLPYTPGSLLDDGSFQAVAANIASSMQSAKERTLYAVHPIPLSEVRAIHKHAPPLGQHKIVVTLANGVSLAPLYFSQGGIKAFFSALREHAHLARSADDPSAYLVNDTADPLQRSLTSMELTDVLLGAPPPGASATFAPMSGPLAESGWEAAESEVPLRTQLVDLVDRFSRTLQSARDTASSFFAASLIPPEEEPAEGLPAQQQRQQAQQAQQAQQLRAHPLPQHPWAARPPLQAVPGLPLGASFAAVYSSSNPDLVEAGSECGAAGGAQAGPETGGSRAGARQGPGADKGGQQQEGDAADTELGVFELIERSSAGVASSPLWTRARPPPLSLEEFNTFCDGEGRLVDEPSFRQRVFYGGADPQARPLVWKLLLGVFPPGSSAEERRRVEAEQLRQYGRLRAQWRSIGKEQATRFAKWRERKARIEKDVRRTDRGVRLYSKERGQGPEMLRGLLLSYSIWNFDLGYVQGMSDLASPILHVIRSQYSSSQLSSEEALCVESQAFWCLTHLMDRMESNFSTDCTGMHAQLVALRRLVQLLDPPLFAHLEAADCLNFYFCYRWVLIHFKREVAFEEVLRLWEALWSCPATPQLHLYCCVAVLEHHRRRIMVEGMEFDSLLKLCVELSGKLDLPSLLRDAEVLCSYAGEAGQECVVGLPVLPGQESHSGGRLSGSASTCGASSSG